MLSYTFRILCVLLLWVVAGGKAAASCRNGKDCTMAMATIGVGTSRKGETE